MRGGGVKEGREAKGTSEVSDRARLTAPRNERTHEALNWATTLLRTSFTIDGSTRSA